MIRSGLKPRNIIFGILILFIVSACGETTTTFTETATLSPTATVPPTATSSPTPTQEVITPTPAPVPISVPAYIHPDLGEAYGAEIDFDAEKLAEMQRQQMQLERLAGWLTARPEPLISGTVFSRFNEDLFTFRDINGETAYISESDLREIGGYREDKDTFFVANYVSEENPTGVKQLVTVDKEGNPFVYLQIYDPGVDNHRSIILPYYGDDGSYWQPGNTKLVAHGVTESIILNPATDDSDVEFIPDFGFGNVADEQITQVFMGVDEEEKLVWAEIPAAPEGADPEIWQAGCLAGLVERRVVNSELSPSWDASLGEGGTVVWKRGENIVWAYDKKYGFVGKIAGESKWIVRNIITFSVGSEPIRGTDLYSLRGEFKDFGVCMQPPEEMYPDLDLGIKGALVEIVGKIVGVREIIDFSKYMERDIQDYNGKEKGMLTPPFSVDENTDLSKWEALRIKTIAGGEVVEVLLLINPKNIPDYKITVPVNHGRSSRQVSVDDFWVEPKEGDMIYTITAAHTDLGDPEELSSLNTTTPNIFAVQAMGMTNMNIVTLKKLGVSGSENLYAVQTDGFTVLPLFKDADKDGNMEGIEDAVNNTGPVFMKFYPPFISGVNW